uniref:WASH complex subunit 3 isoform X2 n=1 Tax=Myxine glutinosa TaxID=7769 RepID=UPI00358EB0B9
MDADGLPIVGSAIDMTKKLAGLALRIQQIETSMSILESKLASIPGLDDLRPEPVDSTLTPNTEGAPVYNLTTHTTNETSNTARRSDVVGEDSPAAENVVTVARDARYARYLKMLQVGVPLMAIRNKMITEGLDPNLLQTPDAPVPSGGESIKSEPAPEVSDSDSEDSLSD